MKKILFPALIVFLIAISSAHGQSPIYEVQLDNCIDLRTESIKVIENNEQLIGAVRNDASRDRCLEKLAEQDLDLFANTLLGVSISSGYCHRPSGLAYEIDTDLILSVSTLRISYTDNDGVRCAALRRYDLWVLIPKPPAGFKIEAKIDTEKNKEKESRDNERIL